ncbi:unnamed protein product [Clonostachys rosea f. rosea IK726]|jgi:hypothetical protein|uniref:Uncharacterized protein n=1 Tax=Clonostachys rosea f. rosea IK726 TaxID=1349383 RepID=A0ACA9UQ38_BIOOC|nr:unnamed protein product [Clonostachys rosea f. rosea IK726]
MFLPQEVIDNIVFSLLTTVYQFEDRAASTQWIDGRVFRTNTCRDKLGIGHRTGFDLEAVCNIRLVSLAWYYSATKLLERHMSWHLDLDSDYSLAKIRHLCIDEVGVGRLLPTRNIVRRLRILPIKTSIASDRIKYEKIEGQPTEEELLQWPKDSAAAYRRFARFCISDVNGEEVRERSITMTAVYDMFHRFLESLVHIESFDIAFPEAYVVLDDQCAESYNFDVIRGISREIEYGLGTEAFSYLQDLRVSLPGTFNVKAYLSGMSQAARDKLKNLFIGITDATGAAGCHDYIRSPWNRTEDLDGTVHDSRGTVLKNPPSRLQLYKPNRHYQDNLWEFVSSCHNLTSLGIKATHYLDLRNFKQDSCSRLNGLKELYLSRIYVDKKCLLRLLLPQKWDKKTSPSLQNLTLEDVKMHPDGGTWCRVMQFLWDHCPNLTYVSLSRLSYFCEHPRAWPRGYVYRVPAGIIATRNEEDIDSVRRIAERFLQREGGILNCPNVYLQMAIGLGYDEYNCEWGEI